MSPPPPPPLILLGDQSSPARSNASYGEEGQSPFPLGDLAYPSPQAPVTVNDIIPQPVVDVLTGEVMFPCPHCAKQYKGKHARSIWRRHLQDKHSIPLAVQPRKTRWDNVADRPKTDEERRQRTLESKRRWARKNRASQKAKRLGIDPSELNDDDFDELCPRPTPQPKAGQSPQPQLQYALQAPVENNMFLQASSAASTSSNPWPSEPMTSTFAAESDALYAGYASLAVRQPAMQRSLSMPVPVSYPGMEQAVLPVQEQRVAFPPVPTEAAEFKPFDLSETPFQSQLTRSLPATWPMQHQQQVEHFFQPPALLGAPSLSPPQLLRRVSAPNTFQSAPSLQRPTPLRAVSMESRYSEPSEQVAMNLLLLKTGMSSAPNSPDRANGPGPLSSVSDSSAATMASLESFDSKKRRWVAEESPDTSADDNTVNASYESKRVKLEQGQPPSSPPDFRSALAHSDSSLNLIATPPHVRDPYHESPEQARYMQDFLGSSPPALSSPSHPDMSYELGLAPDLLPGGRKRNQPLAASSSPSAMFGKVLYPTLQWQDAC